MKTRLFLLGILMMMTICDIHAARNTLQGKRSELLDKLQYGRQYSKQYGDLRPGSRGLDSLQQSDTLLEYQISGLKVTGRKSGTSKMIGAVNGVKINQLELFKAACCNLGESFSTNPSVDVSYSDAATGARQIKLLGLSGIYVQMLTENLPNFRGAAAPYSLGYVPGPWMKSIQVSKGASSVRNGYEAITGQIDIEYLKPEEEEGVSLNLYGNSKSRMEANADANIHLRNQLSTEILAHYENEWGHHDANKDGFLDQPKVRQYNLQNRWKLLSGNYIFHGGTGVLQERREGGQIGHTHSTASANNGNLYKIGLNTDRYEGYMKHAFIIDPEHGTNVALMASGAMHELDAKYGHKAYCVNQKDLYLQLVFETDFTKMHNLSAGFNLNYSYLGQHYRVDNIADGALIRSVERETVPGFYAQYTFNLENKLIAMAGIRADQSSIYGTFFTPRLHIKYSPDEAVTLRLSAGKGYRTPHALAENNYLLASGRRLIVDGLKQERAWNYGISSSFNLHIAGGKSLKLNAEYYYTRFRRQMVTDYDSDPMEIRLSNLSGRSYSHTFQIDAAWPLFEGLELTAAYRLNDVRATYSGRLMRKPLTSRYKALFTASYKTPLGLWQFDATFQFNGGGRMPAPYQTAGGTLSWAAHFPAYGQLNAQITRWFRHFSIYAGGENLTGYRQKNLILNASEPWGSEFEPTMVWGPVHGALIYAGIRIGIGGRQY